MQLGVYLHTCRALIFHMDHLHLPSCSSASLTFVRIPIVNFTAVYSSTPPHAVRATPPPPPPYRYPTINLEIP